MVSLTIQRFPRGEDDGFVTKDVPRCLRTRLMLILRDCRAEAIDAFLIKSFGTTLADALRVACASIRTSWVGDSCIIGIDANVGIPGSQTRLDTALRAVEYGADGLRGTGVFRAAFAYVKDNLSAMYRLHLAEGSLRKNGDKLLR